MTIITMEYDVVRGYAAALDSVAVIAQLITLGTLSNAQLASLWANAKHLEIMVGRNVFTTEQNEVLTVAVGSAGTKVDLAGEQPTVYVT